jgi:hypothetical protein
MKEGSGGDNLAIGWAKPGQSTTTPSEIIPGSVLSPFASGSSNVAVTAVLVNPTNTTISVGATSNLTATISPSNATNNTISWSSSNTSVATVNSAGIITGVASGSAIVTATTQDGNKTATCSVSVTNASVTNLLSSNSSFESETGISYANGAWSGITSWDAFNSGYDHIGVTSGNGYDGSNKLELCKGGWAETKSANRANVTGGSSYNISFALSKNFVYSTSANSPVTVEIKWFNSAGSLISSSSSGNLLNGTATTPWQIFNFDAIAPANAVKAGVRITQNRLSYPNDNLAQVVADKFRLTAGNGLKSSEIEINSTIGSENHFLAFPNPTDGNLSFHFNEPTAVQVSIVNLSGQEMYQFNSEGRAFININIEKILKPGIYIILYISNETNITQKLIVKY